MLYLKTLSQVTVYWKESFHSQETDTTNLSDYIIRVLGTPASSAGFWRKQLPESLLDSSKNIVPNVVTKVAKANSTSPTRPIPWQFLLLNILHTSNRLGLSLLRTNKKENICYAICPQVTESSWGLNGRINFKLIGVGAVGKMNFENHFSNFLEVVHLRLHITLKKAQLFDLVLQFITNSQTYQYCSLLSRPKNWIAVKNFDLHIVCSCV